MPAAANVHFITPQAGALALACTALRRHRVSLDALRVRAEAELVEHRRAPRDMEKLIGRLIDQLDAADGDPDLEAYLAGWEAGADDREGELGHDADSEPDDDLEPSLGWPIGGQFGPYSPSNDCELNPAESGIGDWDGLVEQMGGAW